MQRWDLRGEWNLKTTEKTSIYSLVEQKDVDNGSLMEKLMTLRDTFV